MSVFTLTSAFSLAGVAVIALAAYTGANAFLPAKARQADRFTFMWLVFNAMIHFSFEGPFVYLSTFGRQVNTSEGPFAALWKEYAAADYRWGVSDPALVSLEILSVFAGGPLCCYILWQLVRGDATRHFWIIVLCTAELYGGWVVFCPEWLVGSPNLNTSNPLYLWVYLVLMNIIWVIVPLWLIIESYGHFAKALRVASAVGKPKKT